MSKSELIERTNQALLVAEANGFSETEKALRFFLAELEQEMMSEPRAPDRFLEHF